MKSSLMPYRSNLCCLSREKGPRWRNDILSYIERTMWELSNRQVQLTSGLALWKPIRNDGFHCNNRGATTAVSREAPRVQRKHPRHRRTLCWHCRPLLGPVLPYAKMTLCTFVWEMRRGICYCTQVKHRQFAFKLCQHQLLSANRKDQCCGHRAKRGSLATQTRWGPCVGIRTLRSCGPVKRWRFSMWFNIQPSFVYRWIS
mmetsp:Transcript_39975/g.83173  ORF Transcript_39975/g.83173 Transcript_39975/m.83173 type:complete len:201 (-) Transcript_39975:1177-1779(-)